MSTHADAAKMIRQELKKAFPVIKFSVSSKTYAGGNSITTKWIDGPTSKEIHKIIDKYQYGYFDGMIDCYEMSNCRDDIPQVKFVFADREVSEKTFEEAFLVLQKEYNVFDKVFSIDETNHELLKHWNAWTAREYIRQRLCKIDLSKGFTRELMTQ